MPERPAVVCDVDGTVCDVRNIRYLVDGSLKTRSFGDFHARSLECPANLAVKRILELSRDLGYAVLMVTGRQERYAFLTVLWMHENNIRYDELCMRQDSDGRPDRRVKTDMLQSLSRRYTISLAIDDNPSTIPVWIDANIPTVTIGSAGELLGISSKRPDNVDNRLVSVLKAEFSTLAPRVEPPPCSGTP
jgi:hypothetical protein